MSSRGGAAHVVTTTRKYKGKVYQTHLLRRSYREDGKVKNETLGNLSHLPDHVIELVRRALKGERFVAAEDAFSVVGSKHHGHVRAVRIAMRQLGFDQLLGSKPSRERDLVVAMVIARILRPKSKLATRRWWENTTLPQLCRVAGAHEAELYNAMDWLFKRKGQIEKKLSSRHLRDGGLVLYDLTSSYLEGKTCPLGARGYSRDGKRGKLQINYGLLTDERGCPVSVSVFKGNTADPATLLPQVTKARDVFGIDQLVIVGDRGMISQKHIKEFKESDNIDWITALKSGAIRTLMKSEQLQPTLFDDRNLFEFTDDAYPGERLVACRNPELAKLRAHKRQSMLEATTMQLAKVSDRVANGRLKGKDKIGLRVGKVVNQYKMAKHIRLDIGGDYFRFQINRESVAAEAALDGIYTVRTSVELERMPADDVVRNYKKLSNVERAFRSLKTVDLKVRPIFHHLEERVRAHVFLCVLAYYVEWHMREAWRPLLFCDEDQQAKATRDPVAPAKRSADALEKVHAKVLDDGTPAHSFRTLLEHLSTIVRNTCVVPGSEQETFTIDTTPNDKQTLAFELLRGVAP